MLSMIAVLMKNDRQKEKKMIPVEKLQQILDESTSSGKECGLQLVIYQHGHLAADLVSGWTDSTHSRKVTAETLFPIFSSGKAVMTIAFHKLKEEFGFDYSEKVVDYWPEFTGSGKEKTEIRHILSHRTGLHFLPGVPDTSPLVADWKLMCKNLCAAKPKWEPGTRCGYQGLTFAWLVGELAYRISGIPFKEYITDRILRPLGLEKDFFFGITDDAASRLVQLDDTAFNGAYTWTKAVFVQETFRKAFFPSANGIATAGAAARIFNALYHGPAPLLRPETIDNATQLLRHPEDPIRPGSWEKFGLGFALPNWETDGNDIFGHGGAAGSELFYCRSMDLVLCFVKNRPLPSHPLHPVRDRISEALGLPTRFW